MIPLFNDCLKLCHDILDIYAKEKRPVPIRDVITRLTLDMTSKCAFGADFGVQHNANSDSNFTTDIHEYHYNSAAQNETLQSLITSNIWFPTFSN
uniref:Uncharacterized protein n=1 Tax=Heterorhabditis bacteriophora TaxID=37862 RepID=A0A1I7XFF0_HETBA